MPYPNIPQGGAPVRVPGADQTRQCEPNRSTASSNTSFHRWTRSIPRFILGREGRKSLSRRREFVVHSPAVAACNKKRVSHAIPRGWSRQCSRHTSIKVRPPGGGEKDARI